MFCCNKQMDLPNIIAPAPNCLIADSVKIDDVLTAFDDKIQQIIHDSSQPLFPPNNNQSFPSLSHHCVAMSLHFIKRFRQNNHLEAAALTMLSGGDLECSQTSLIYNGFYHANIDKYPDLSEISFRHRIKNATAKTLDLELELIQINYPFEHLLSFLTENLPQGEYVLSLPTHDCALIKDEKGAISLFNPGIGTILLSGKQEEEYFLSLLKSNNIHLSEDLLLFKIYDCDLTNPKNFNAINVEYDEKEANLIIKKNDKSDSWNTAVFEWRDNRYYFPIHQETGLIYNDDSKSLIRKKCLLLVPRTIIDTTARTICHIVITIFSFFKLISVVVLRQDSIVIKKEFHKLEESFCDVFRSPIYGIFLTLTAAYGIFNPLSGRHFYSSLERKLNRQEGSVSFSTKYYSAPCFNPWNLKGVDHIRSIQQIKELVLRRKYLELNFCVDLMSGWRRAFSCCKNKSMVL